ncbi:MAG: glycosyltransferase [Acidobacteria bacterium]|nr:glycosyltransferase [Acidobacteriota bacterium]
MRIGIDGGAWTNRRGYGRFLRELVAALAALGTEHRYVVFLDSSADRDERWPAGFEPRFVGTSTPVGEAARADGRRSLADMARMSLAAARERLDVFFFPTVYSYFPLLRPVRTVVGVHDTIAEDFPELAFASPRNERFWRWKVRAALWQADACLTVSEHSRSCIERVYGYPGAQIHVAREAPAATFTPGPEPREDFLLYVGGISPTKNLETLLRAFAASAAPGLGLRLLLVGDYAGDRFKTCHAALAELARELGVAESVTFAGYVPDEELAGLYRRTRLFVMPSWDEGFGLPAVEAMACGAPVLVSRGHALEEAVGDAGLLADTHSPESFREQIDRALADDALRAELSRRAVERAGTFSWEETARRTLELLTLDSKR